MQGGFTVAHLWFILLLLAFSTLGLPLFLWLRGPAGRRMTDVLAARLHHRGALFLMVLPLAAAATLNIFGDKNPLYYFPVFVAGFWLTADERFQRVIDREAPLALALGLMIELARRLAFVGRPLEWSAAWMAHGLLYEANRWIWMIAFLGFAHRLLNGSNRTLKYLSEASYPFYILHMPVNTLVAYFILRLEADVGLKFLAVVGLTTLGTFAAYELVKRVDVLCFLLGLKPASRAPGRASPRPADEPRLLEAGSEGS
jgi:peptidoglycan/LPS O-acetylase OafA/YrhL